MPRVTLRVESLDGRITPGGSMGAGGADVYPTGAALLGGSIEADDQFAIPPTGGTVAQLGGSLGGDDQFDIKPTGGAFTLPGGSIGIDDQF